MATSDSVSIPRLPQVDVLRGAAAVSVVVFHYSGHAARYFPDFPFTFEIGRFGVELFFAISGFFIFSTVDKCAGAWEFVLLRFSRLYPAYWATLLMLLIYDLMGDSSIWVTGYVANATMLQSIFGIKDLDIVFWSLAVEMMFYFLMAILMATGAIQFPTAVVVIWLGASNIWPMFRDLSFAQSDLVKTMSGVVIYGPFFVIGMVYYILQKVRWNRPLIPLVLLASCAITEFNTDGFEMGIAAIVVIASMGCALQGWLRVFVNPVTLWLGAISFSLYLVHRNFGYLVLFKLISLGIDNRLAFGLVLCGALALASALTYWIEIPSLAYLRSVLVKTRRKPSIRVPAE